MVLPQEDGLGKEAQALKAGLGSFGKVILEFGSLILQSVAQKRVLGLKLVISPWFLRLVASWRRGEARGGPEGGPFKHKIQSRWF